MGCLPAEITANIIAHLAEDGGQNNRRSNTTPPRGLFQYATVSRRWQQNIEALTFAHVKLTPARLASPLAAQALVPDRVRRFVRSIEAKLFLPPYDEAARGRYEDATERREANALFTTFIRHIFALLSPSPDPPSTEVCGEGDGRQGQQPQQPEGVNVMTGYHPKIRLSLTASCASDTEDMMERHFATFRGGSGAVDLFEARYESSYIDLLPAAGRSVQDEAEALPKLACVSEFHVRGFPGLGFRAFVPRTLCLLAARMSGLETVNWELCDNEKRDVALRNRLRTDFANTLEGMPSTLQYFSLYYDRREPKDHSFQTPSIIDETDHGNDKLSLALYKLSQRLTTFDLSAQVGPEILWPQQTELDQQEQDENPPLWPNMRWYSFCPGPIAPSGQWLFRWGPDDDPPEEEDDDADSYDSEPEAAPGDEKDNMFREERDPDAIAPLLLAAARAAGRMPVLCSMFFLLNSVCSSGSLDVSYKLERSEASAGVGSTRTGGEAVTAKLKVDGDPVFQPDVELMQAWRKAAREHVGTESKLEVFIID